MEPGNRMIVPPARMWQLMTNARFLGSGANETNMVVSITITGDSQCVSTNVTYRLDTASATRKTE